MIDTDGVPGFIESELKTKGGSRNNLGEVYLVVNHIQKLIQAGVCETQIGVIAPYAMQVNTIREVTFEEFPNIEIATVDGFQGREKEAIIISMVRSNNNGKFYVLNE